MNSVATVSIGQSGIRWLWISLLVIVADQLSKLWIERTMVLGDSFTVLPMLDIVRAHNSGAAFSFLADAGGWQRWAFSVLAIGVSIALVIWLRKLALATQGLLAFGLALILGGAIGNVIDRVEHGYVVDFVHVHWGSAFLPGVQRRGFRHHHRRGPGDPRLAAGRPSRAPRRMKILLANPRGFCAGVDRAIDIVERAIGLFGAPIYVRHEVVHNVHVVERLRQLGAVFVDELDQVPDGATVIFSAHGVPAAVETRSRAARTHGVRCHLSAGDQGAHGSRAVCARGPRRGAHRPRRTSGGRGHHGALRHRARRAHASHRERRAGREARRCAIPEKLAFVTQTTLSVDDTAAIVNALRERFPDARQSATRGHLLCHAESPGRREGAHRQLRRAGRGRLDHQFQFQPAARAGRTRRPARLSHRRRVVPASASGSRARVPSASPPARRRPRNWCSRWWRDYASGAAPRRRSSWGAMNTWCSRCRGIARAR